MSGAVSAQPAMIRSTLSITRHKAAGMLCEEKGQRAMFEVQVTYIQWIPNAIYNQQHIISQRAAEGAAGFGFRHL